MNSRLKIQSVELAVEIYYTSPEIGTAEIMKLFGCSSSAAGRLKKAVREIQAQQGIMTFSSLTVNTKSAYQAWNIDIADMEKRLSRYRKLQKGA